MAGGAHARAPILITGGTGQVGFELVRELVQFGLPVAPSRREMDLASAASISAMIADMKPCAIVNAGAYTAVDRAEEEPDEAERVNAEAPRILAREARRLGIPLIHFSTDYVFDGCKTEPYIETDDTNPLSVYGVTKLAGEEAVRDAGGDWIILRCSWVYSMRGSNFLRTMLRLGNERPEVSVVNDQWGAPTWAREIARATSRIFGDALSVDLRSGFGDRAGLYHLTAGGATTWNGFARAIFDQTSGIDATLNAISTADYKTLARRPVNSLLDSSKIASAFGIRMQAWQEQLNLCMEAKT